jgi:GNAT superfamily N-acetyltransferase
MSSITIEPATPERWDDVVATMTGGGDGGSCWCRWFSITSAQWKASSSAERRAGLEREITTGPARGLLAYVDGAPAGWVRVAPRVEQPRLARSRVAKASGSEPADPAVWAITCFQVRREYRGLGLVGRLVQAAVRFARDEGAGSVEAYPVDTVATPVSDNTLFHGPASTFLANGFTEVTRPTTGRPVLVRRLTRHGTTPS